MGTNTKQYICNCALAPEEHLVYLNKRRDHMENLARFEKAQHESAADLDKICDGVSNLNVRDGQGTDGVISLMQSLSLTQAMDMTTVLTLTDNAYIHEDPVKQLDLIAQVMILLGIICHVIVGLGTDPANFILDSVTLIIKLVMSMKLEKKEDGTEGYDAEQQDLLEQLPSSLYVAMKRFNIDGKTVQYAVCPSCHHTHAPINPAAAVPSYSATCVNRVVDKSGARTVIHRPPCSNSLRSGIEQKCDEACDAAFAALKNPPPVHSTNIFDSEFMRSFEGPVPGQLFIDRKGGKEGKGRMRLPYAIFLDFFNPNRTTKRGNHDSIGLLSAVPLSLGNERNKPENIYLSILTVNAWERGIHISPTGASPEGRDVDVAFALAINDLPAARKLAGAASHKSHFYCTVCSCYGIPTMYRSDFDHNDWQPRDVNELRRAAEAWRDATTLNARNTIFHQYGVRWSEMWWLPYWNPSRMLVIDPMHCILEGIIHYHCRHVLQIDAEAAKDEEAPVPAFEYDFHSYDPDDAIRVESEKEQNQIDSLHAILVLPLDGPAATIRTKGEFLKRVCRKNKKPLQHVCWSLGLDPTPNDLKADLAEKLWKWKVIADTVTPAWINSVPKNYGQNNAGTIKADEWRVLATIYIPIVLVLMWGDDLSGQHAAHFFTLLMHSMAVFQAATLACRYSTSESRASAYRNFIKHWIDQLHSLHPHAKFHDRKKRPNIHAAFHIFDFLRLFGPRINTNDHIGGEMEASILKSFMRGANLRRWLNRSDCPQVIREFKRLFDLAFTPRDFREETPPKNDQEHAHYNFQGVNYSRASTHLGNSLVLFYPLNSTQATAGSIEKITGADRRPLAFGLGVSVLANARVADGTLDGKPAPLSFPPFAPPVEGDVITGGVEEPLVRRTLRSSQLVSHSKSHTILVFETLGPAAADFRPSTPLPHPESTFFRSVEATPLVHRVLRTSIVVHSTHDGVIGAAVGADSPPSADPRTGRREICSRARVCVLGAFMTPANFVRVTVFLYECAATDDFDDFERQITIGPIGPDRPVT
ncbi:hypothetical protein MVEN_02647000 [Mycena venus]|uniref:Uncharacterized protein n=1 Tax=Mycena venus TaxID=2733690 RepID=A0A8H6WMS5_9AGAR|nr:hypothetical protein MVEN_02647000 [Mycena venus]